MRRYVTLVLISMTITGLLTGCGHSADIGKDKAEEIALEDAGLTESDVTRLRISKDRDDGESIYDVEFTSGNMEYDYEILASNGDILSADYEESYAAGSSDQTKQEQKDTQSGNDQAQGNAQEPAGGQGQNGNAQSSAADVQLTLEEASKLALDRVPGATAQDLKIKLDYDDGRQMYEGDIVYDQKEYEFEIDANTGDFLEWKEERR